MPSPSAIPTCNSLQSSPLVHRLGDTFNPPGLTNFLGCVQVDLDPVAIRSHNYPPLATSDTVTGKLFWNDRIFGATGVALTTTWFPDRIDRVAEIDGFELRSTTAMAVGRTATLVHLRITNRSSATRIARFKLGCRGNVTHALRPWSDPLPPSEKDNIVELDEDRGALFFRSKNDNAFCLQGTHPKPLRVTPQALHFEFSLSAGETKELSYVDAVGYSREEVRTLFEALVPRVPQEIGRARDDWNAELAACFTPGNDRYSGFMPTLETSDAAVLKNYHMGVLGTIYFKRTIPQAAIKRAYATLLPRNWQTATFLWDYMLSSTVHALLDPAEMREALLRWTTLDIHNCFGSDILTAKGIGPWYAVNDYAITTIARDYLRYSGEMGLMKERIGEGTLKDYLVKVARNWRNYQTPNGLADYGGLLNLLECVNSYVHEVASLNAANVFSLRAAADLLETLGDTSQPSELRDEARQIIDRLQSLYVNGKGYWYARDPDGNRREVRHCYDIIAVLNSIPNDLTAAQRGEITDFFLRELKTDHWMIALSPGDDDAIFDVRADHQWTGAYTAWPAMTALGLYRIGRGEVALDWYRAMAKSANQGPFGQAQFADGIYPLEAGGALKTPQELPHICDWACSSAGAWCSVVLEGIFGINATLTGVTAKPAFHDFDRDARLTNFRHHGRLYTVDRGGIKAQ